MKGKILKTGIVGLVLTAVPAGVAFADFGALLGSYSGTGQWNGNSEGRYQVAATIEPSKVCSTYSWESGSSEFCLVASFLSDTVYHTPSGYGFCEGNACTFRVRTPDGFVEESFSVENDQLLRSGMKSADGSLIRWTEVLERLP